LTLLALCGLVSACGGDDDAPAPEPPIAAIEQAAASADRYLLAVELTEDLAAGSGAREFQKAENDLGELAREAERATGKPSTNPVERKLNRASEHLADAAEELSLTARELGKAAKLRDREQEPSEMAQTALAEAATRVDRLAVRVGDAKASHGKAFKLLSDGVGDLSDDPSLGSEASSVNALGRRIAKVEESAASWFQALRKTVSTESRTLSARSEELTPEPPDVVLDCPSAYGTVSDLSVRNMSCAEADAVVIQAIPVLAPSFAVAGFSCSILGEYGPPGGPILGASDIRCESGDRAFRFGFAD